MPLSLLGPYLVLLAVLMRALVVAAKLAPASCARCGRAVERHELGAAACSCAKQ